MTHEPQGVGGEVAWPVHARPAPADRQRPRPRWVRGHIPDARRPPRCGRSPASSAGTPSVFRKWTNRVRWRWARGSAGLSSTSRNSMPLRPGRALTVDPSFSRHSRSRSWHAPGRHLETPPLAVAACGGRRTAPSPAASSRRSSTSTASTAIRSPSHCWSAPCTGELRGGGELGAVRRKHQLQQPAAERRPVDALARAR